MGFYGFTCKDTSTYSTAVSPTGVADQNVKKYYWILRRTLNAVVGYECRKHAASNNGDFMVICLVTQKARSL
jgi:hypothetical protein